MPTTLRVRSRSDLKSIPGHLTSRNAAGTQIYWDGDLLGWSWTYHDWFRDIYKTGKDVRLGRSTLPGGVGGPNPNPCLRISIALERRSRVDLWNPADGSREVSRDIFQPISETALWGLVPSIGSTQRNALGVKAWESFNEQVPQEVSIANFLWEARELSALLPKIEGSLAKTVAGGYLNYQFGWKPFIGDLIALRDLSKNVRARLKWLRDTFGKPLRLGCSMDLTLEGPAEVEVAPFGYGGFSDQIVARRTEFRGIARAGCWFEHHLQDLAGLDGEIRAFVGALGLTNPAGVVWEAIPYSFVADWFTSVGSRTKEVSFNPFPGEWKTWHHNHSFTTEVAFDLFQRCPSPYAPYPLSVGSEVRIGSGRIKRYERNVGMPVPASVLTSTSLDTRQQLLAAALLGARM